MISPSLVRRCMVASMVMRSIIVDRTGVSRGKMGKSAGNFQRKGMLRGGI